MVVSRRLSATESAKYKDLDARRCAACGTIYPRPKVPDNFAPDKRTSDGYSRLCIDCLLLRDLDTARRGNETKADYATRQRASIREARQAHARALIQAALPDHAIPRFAFDGYPDSDLNPKAPPRPPARAARLTWMYGKLRDAGLTTWEQVSAQPRHLICQNIDFGVVSFAAIDEHLAALGLPPLKP